MTGSDWQAEVAETARRHRELHERLATVSIDETSRDGTVRVTVSASGQLTGLVFAETGRPVALSELAEQVMDCVRRAQARIPELLRSAVAESVGDADPNTHLLVAEARQRFPEPPPRPPEPRGWQPDEIRYRTPETSAEPPVRPTRPSTAPARSRRVDEETWDEERPILRDV